MSGSTATRQANQQASPALSPQTLYSDPTRTKEHIIATITEIDQRVTDVARALPFPVELLTDLGGNLTLQINLGRRGQEDDPTDTAGIDPDDPHARWWVDIEGGTKTLISPHGIDTPTKTVAAWVARQARAQRCPAALVGRAHDTGPHTGPTGPDSVGPSLT